MKPQCQALTRKGKPCRFPARRDTDYCINHEDGADTSAISGRASRAAATAAIRRAGPSANLLDTAFSFTDRASIQAMLDTTVRLVLAGRISDQSARLIVRACSIAARNFDATVETINGPKPPAHDWFPYFDRVTALLSTVDPLLDEAAEHAREAMEQLGA